MTEITPILFIGDEADVAGAQAAGIEVVINVAAELVDTTVTGITYYKIPLVDGGQNTCDLMRTAVETINTAQTEGKKTLVHCHAGVNRGPSMVAFYFQEFLGWDINAALAMIQALDPAVSPNIDLWASILACGATFDECVGLECCPPAIFQFGPLSAMAS